ncbi:MAG: dephospho-CoA kinase [Tissierellia bacterium]|nr:dephospho-CoA kinase [Tissierellia bacterium]
MKSSYGITGDIASGKSTLSAYLKDLGFQIIDADIIAREVMEPGNEGHLLVMKAFPEAFIGKELIREKLASIIYGDKKKRKELDQLLHPLIIRIMLERQGPGTIFHDAPLLYESGLDQYLKKVIYVAVDPKIQLERLMKRDGINSKEALKKMDAFEFPRDEKIKRSYVIENNESPEKFYEKIQIFLKEEGLI